MSDSPTETQPEQQLEGWAFPTTTARKAHFFRGPDRRSLCPDDCKACADKLEASR